MLLIKNGDVYSPEHQGKVDILVSNDKIAAIGDFEGLENIIEDLEIIDATDKYVVPGFIDQHVHILGAGGESGPTARTPEINLTTIISSGITTVAGLIGTDGTNRHLESLLAKARGLEEEGISTYIYTGAYELPSPNLTGSVRRDLVLIDKIVGLKLAISDHRCSYPTKQELLRSVSDVRVGGMLKGILGVLHMHMGDDIEALNTIMEIVDERPILIPHFVPTHVNRTDTLFNQCIEFAKKGGTIDISSGLNTDTLFSNTLKCSDALEIYIQSGSPIENITMSSDGNGSAAQYNDDGTIDKMCASDIRTLYTEFKDMVLDKQIKMEDALKLITINVSKKLSIYPKKGTLLNESDADILLLDKELEIDKLFAKGKLVVEDGKPIIKGTFEK